MLVAGTWQPVAMLEGVRAAPDYEVAWCKLFNFHGYEEAFSHPVQPNPTTDQLGYVVTTMSFDNLSTS
jgi:hypothetical protein